MSGFGDMTTEDAFDTEPADTEIVAARLRDGLESVAWETVPFEEIVNLSIIVNDLMEWLRRQGAVR